MFVNFNLVAMYYTLDDVADYWQAAEYLKMAHNLLRSISNPDMESQKLTDMRNTLVQIHASSDPQQL